MQYWRIIYTTVLSLTPLTWALILAPAILMLILIWLGRRAILGLPSDVSVWRAVAQRWQRTGLVILASAVVIYLADVVLSLQIQKYNETYALVLGRRTNALVNSAPLRQAVARSVLGRMSGDQIRDAVIQFARDVSPDNRLSLLNLALGSHYDPGVVDLGYLLHDRPPPPGEMDSFAKNTNIPLSAEQRRLWENKLWPDFWASLNSDQWIYVSRQIFASQGLESLINMANTLVADMPPKESLRLVNALVATCYPHRKQLGIRLAVEAGLPHRVDIFTFALANISWMRGLLWLLVWLAGGLAMLVQAGRMLAATSPFKIK